MRNKPVSDVLSQGESFRQQALLNFAFDHMTQALYLIDDQARFLHVNQESCRMLGYSCDDLLRMTVLDIDPELTPARWAEHWQQVMDTRTTVLNGLHRTRDGGIFPVEISVSRFEFDGRYFILALAQDMTERQRTKEKLQRSEQEFRALAENSPDTIARYDSACRRLYCNPALASVCGVPVDLLLGNPPSALMPTASARCFEDALRAVFCQRGRPSV